MKQQSYDLLKDNPWSLALKLAIPTALAQLVNVLYAIVDKMFIGHIPVVGNLALAGVGVSSPVTTFIASFSCLIGLGGAPIMAMNAGYGDKKEAEGIVGTAFYLLLILAGILTPLFFFSRNVILLWFGASELTLPYASTYIGIYLLGTPFALLSGGMNSYLINQGKTGMAMAAVLCSAILNTILDPIFIFIFKMGIKGAAIATVISQLASAIFILSTLRSSSVEIRLCFNRFNHSIIIKVLKFGISPFLINSTDSLLLIVLNSVLQRFGGASNGDILITVATIVQSYFLLIMNPLGGISAGCQGLTSYNFGAGDIQRVKKSFICAQTIATSFTTIMQLLTLILAPQFVRLFTADPDLQILAARYIRIFTSMFIPLSFQYINVDQLTALGKIKLSLPFSLFRKALFLIFTISLPYALGATSAFLAEPLCDIIAATVSTTITWNVLPKILKERTEQGLVI